MKQNRGANQIMALYQGKTMIHVNCYLPSLVAPLSNQPQSNANTAPEMLASSVGGRCMHTCPAVFCPCTACPQPSSPLSIHLRLPFEKAALPFSRTLPGLLPFQAAWGWTEGVELEVIFPSPLMPVACLKRAVVQQDSGERSHYESHLVCPHFHFIPHRCPVVCPHTPWWQSHAYAHVWMCHHRIQYTPQAVFL